MGDVGHGANDHETVMGKGELLLSVSVQGRPRYGVRWRRRPPHKAVVVAGTDLPIEVDPDDPQKIEIRWDSIRDRPWGFAAGVSAIPHHPRSPVQRAPVAPGPLDELKRLAELHQQGAITEAEFAQERARRFRQL